MNARLAGRMDRLTSEGAFDVMARAAALEAAGREIVHLEIGEPQFPTPPHVVEAAERALRDGYTRYCPPPGLPAFREAAAAFLGRTRGVDAPAARVVAAPGAKPLIFYVILALSGAGDEVVVPDPGFPTYASVAAFAGATPIPLPLRAANDFRVDPDELASLVSDRTRLVVLNSPHNPTGGALTAADLEAVAEVVAGRDLHVLSDEVYWSMRYDAGHVSPAALGSLRDRTILLDGCSKTFAMTGWRLGFALLPPALVEPVTRLLVNSVSCTAAFVQMAGVAALDGPAEDTAAMRAELRRRRDLMVGGLRQLPGVACTEPAGAFYAFPDIRGLGASSADVADRLLEHAGVACLPGTAFGVFGEGHLRLSYAAAPGAITAALEAMASALPEFS
ncbi:MAG: pyridoxal phosphate-dependent aminotransferase [Actinomycetota bacterium]